MEMERSAIGYHVEIVNVVAATVNLKRFDILFKVLSVSTLIHVPFSISEENATK